MKKIAPLIFLILNTFCLWSNSKADLFQDYQNGMVQQNWDRAELALNRLSQRRVAPGRLEFNRGTAEFQQGNYEAAAESFDEARSLLRSDRKKAQSSYNLGNSYAMAMNETEDQAARESLQQQAIQAYLDALQWDPDMEEASHNLERLLQQEQQQQQNDDSNGDEDSDSSEEEPSSEGEHSQSSDGEQQDSQSSQEQDQQDQQDQQEQQEEQEEQEEEQKASQEQQIQDILDQEEEDREERNLEQYQGGIYEVDKDW